MRFRNLLRPLVLLAVVVFLEMPVLFGQSAGTGAITGTLTDPSGGTIPNATVTLTNTQTNQVRTATTGTDGSYRFTFIQPGAYRVRFSAMGFKVAEAPRST